jgi:hypothetical protein
MPTYMVVIDKGHRSDDSFGVAFLSASTPREALELAAAPHMGYVQAGDEVWVADKRDTATYHVKPAITFASAQEEKG